MEKPDKSTGAANESSGIRALGHVAAKAGQSEIGRCGRAALFATDDVIHMKGKVGILLMNQTVFTNTVCPLDDETSQPR